MAEDVHYRCTKHRRYRFPAGVRQRGLLPPSAISTAPIDLSLMPKSKFPSAAHVLCGVLLTATALMSTGCASIVHGGPRMVTASTVPSGAKTTLAKTSGEVISVNTTPFTVALSPRAGYFKGQSYTLKFELPGYTPTEVALNAKLSNWYWGNIVFGGLVGIIVVDPLTGSMWNLSPDKIEQPLAAEQTALIKSGDGFVVMLAAQLTDGERGQMVRVN